MIIKKTQYKTSAVDKAGIIKDNVPEFAFVGRSNVGKSTLINALTNCKNLAKTSQRAGLTKMVNYFDINDSFRFVDLPGYGYAQVGKRQLDVWASLMSDYLTTSQSLLTVFMLVDIRITPTKLDKEMLRYLIFNKIPFRVIATKCDKLSRAAIDRSLNEISKELGIRKEFILTSSGERKQGTENILDYIQTSIEAYNGQKS